MTNTTDGHRIYAIGDIHGCLEQLQTVQANIQRDLLERPHASPVIIYLGDFIDRGPDSRGVIENLMAEHAAPHHTHLLLGNHDQMVQIYSDDPATPIRPNGPLVKKIHWLHEIAGGAETLRSYGVEGADADRPQDTHAAFLAAFPDTHMEFIRNLEIYVRFGSYLFVHAGINPDAALEDQTEDDFLWMREPFLSSTKDHGFTVVHGHSPSKEVQNRGNRIGIDTGAVFGRKLSCLVLEDADQALLEPTGIRPCAVDSGD